jgi:magnesium chelatase family protein
MVIKIISATTQGVDALPIEIEVNKITQGLPKFVLVGLPDRAVNEANYRIESAVKHLGYEYPFGKITVNLAPADLPKEGSAFDLPIAIALLAANAKLNTSRLADSLMVGELALNGDLRPVKGVLPMAILAKKMGLKHIVVPQANGYEAGVVNGINVYAVNSLKDVVEWMNNLRELETVKVDVDALFNQPKHDHHLDLNDVKGHEKVKRAMEVAAAGGHNLILVGPPGSGKTMMARRMPSILPPLSLDEALEATKIYSVSGLLKNGQALLTERPFRSPHHTVSDVALVGGGSIPMPGEISLSHNGVLFLDELPEFKRSALEVMRQPLEDGFVSISRARMSVTYPSRIMLVASMNPSPSGDWHNPNLQTLSDDNSTARAMHRYLAKISGPLLDRIDLHVEVNKVSFDDLADTRRGESSEVVRERVIKAREIQKRRYLGISGVYANAQMHPKIVRKVCKLNASSNQLLKKAIEKLGLSARAYDRILKVARTIADLGNSENIESVHISEAIQYRNLDREGWLG